MKLSILIPAYNTANLITKGLDSIPDGIEIIVIDDGSEDNTLETVREYAQAHPSKNLRVIHFEENKGVSAALNRGLDEAQGDYVVLLGSDGDYFLQPAFRQALAFLDGKVDLVYFDIIDNNRHVRRLNDRTKFKYVGAVKFMRRAFIGKIRFPEEMRRAEDVVFTQQILAKNPKERFTQLVVKHYNYPREGSLTWKYLHGQTDYSGNTLK